MYIPKKTSSKSLNKNVFRDFLKISMEAIVPNELGIHSIRWVLHEQKPKYGIGPRRWKFQISKLVRRLYRSLFLYY